MRQPGSFLFAMMLGLLAGCANQVTPGGGEKDTKPPVVEKEVPANYSTHFTAKEIRIAFDELVQVNELATQLVVSPPLHHMPESKLKKKTLILQLDDTLKPNTTYTLNFGRAIGDLHENNSLENYAYVFSTGDFVDTLSVSGSVMNAREQVPEKGVKVMLYSEDWDSVVYHKVPQYFAISDSSGHFHIANISAGNYKLFALKETNNNYLYDSPDESIAFLTERIDAGKEGVVLQLFHEEPAVRFQKAYSPQPGKAVVVMQGTLGQSRVEIAGDTSGLGLVRQQWNATGDTLVLWYKNIQRDSLSLIVSAGTRTDTTTFRLQRKDDRSGRQRNFALYLTPSVQEGGPVLPDKPVFIHASQPVSEWNQASITLLEDSVPVQPVITPDSNGMGLSVLYAWKENRKYLLTLLPGAAKDIYGLSSDSLRTGFHRIRAIEFGTLQVKLSSNGFPGNCIFQLVNDKQELQRETICHRDTTIFYENLSPATYRIRLVQDVNKNGKEDTGDYIQHRQPEEVLWYSEKFIVRANWDVELTWKAVFQ